METDTVEIAFAIGSLMFGAWACMKAFTICVDRAKLVEQNEFLHEQLETQEYRHQQIHRYTIDHMISEYDKPYVDYLIQQRMGLLHSNENEVHEKPKLRIHINEPYRPQHNHSPQPHYQPAYVYTNNDNAEYDEAESPHFFRQPETHQIGMQHIGRLPYLNDDNDVIDVPVVYSPPPEPPKKRGRPKKYQNSADKQRAYRNRNRE